MLGRFFGDTVLSGDAITALVANVLREFALLPKPNWFSLELELEFDITTDFG